MLRAVDHGGDEDGAWVLLEAVEPAAAPVEPVAAAAGDV